jgi:hypothetical protein
MTRDKDHKVSLCAILSILFLPLSYALMSSAAAYSETPPTAKLLIIIIIIIIIK